MLAKITNQKLLTIIIIVFLTMQFVLTITGHRQLDTDIHLAAQGQLAADCSHPFSDAIESKDR